MRELRTVRIELDARTCHMNVQMFIHTIPGHVSKWTISSPRMRIRLAIGWTSWVQDPKVLKAWKLPERCCMALTQEPKPGTSSNKSLRVKAACTVHTAVASPEKRLHAWPWNSSKHSRTKRGLYCPFSSPGVKCRVAVADSAPSVIGDDLVIVMRSAIDNVHRKSRLRTTPSYVHGPVMMQPAYAFLHWTYFFGIPQRFSEILVTFPLQDAKCLMSKGTGKLVHFLQLSSKNVLKFANGLICHFQNIGWPWSSPQKNVVSPFLGEESMWKLCQFFAYNLSDPIWNLHWLNPVCMTLVAKQTTWLQACTWG